jgi:hypothetical protein
MKLSHASQYAVAKLIATKWRCLQISVRLVAVESELSDELASISSTNFRGLTKLAHSRKCNPVRHMLLNANLAHKTVTELLVSYSTVFNLAYLALFAGTKPTFQFCRRTNRWPGLVNRGICECQ